jgi:hypothetical protein
MKTRALLFIVACSTLFTTFTTAQQPPLETSLKIFKDQPLPTSVVSGTLRNFQYTSELNAVIGIDQAVPVKSAEFYLVIFNHGRVVSGEGWVQPNPSGSISRQTRLALHEGDEALLIVNSVVTATRTIALPKTDIADNILHLIRNEPFNALPVEISMLILPDLHLKRAYFQGTFCQGAASLANSTCGGGQVQSFSCNATAQSFSFTCKGPAPVQP